MLWLTPGRLLCSEAIEDAAVKLASLSPLTEAPSYEDGTRVLAATDTASYSAASYSA